MLTCDGCIHKELCDIYASFGVTDVPADDITPCQLSKNKADVVEVVRCKNCIFGKYIEDSGNYKCTSFNGRFGIVKAEDFCSYGERRSDDG